MPSLGKHDPLANVPATVGDVDEMRRAVESIVSIAGHHVQFDQIGERRMRLALLSLEPSQSIDWRMADNTTATFTYAEFAQLIADAEVEAGRKIQAAHQFATALKARIDAGEKVSLRDIQSNVWTL